MYFKDLDGVKNGDLVKIHNGIHINGYFSKLEKFGIYVSESKDSDYFAYIFVNGKLTALNKILLVRI